jgi:porphobilinogen synthase
MVPRINQDSNKHPISARFFWPIFIAGSQYSAASHRNLPDFFPICSNTNEVLTLAERAAGLALGGIILYELLPMKTENASSSLQNDTLLINSLRTLQKEFPELLTIVDLCVCQYSKDSHCRIDMDEERTTQHLLRQAALLLDSGAKGLMPSAMIPNFSRTLREWGEESRDAMPFIMSQTAKFNSPLFSLFRSSEAMNTTLDKSAYQLNTRDTALALSCIAAELEGGADCTLIKPGLAFLDVLHEARATHASQTLGSFLTSGEHQLLGILAASTGKKDPLYYVYTTAEALLDADTDVIVSYSADKLVESLFT